MKLCITLLLLLSCLFAEGQTEGLKGSDPDTLQVNRLIRRAHEISSTNNDSAIFYVEEALLRSKKLDYPYGLMRGNLEKANLIGRQNRGKSLECNLIALSFAQQLHLTHYESLALNHSANQAFMMGDYYVAEDYYMKALVVDKANKDKIRMVKNYTNLGMVYTQLTDYTKAFDVLTLSSQLADSLGLKSMVGGNYMDIASILALQKKYEAALAYYEKAEPLFKAAGDSIMLESANMGKGELYMQMGKYNEAIVFFLAMDKAEKFPDGPHSQFGLYQDLGISFMAVKNFKEAELYFFKAQHINDQIIHVPSYSLLNYLSLARLYRQIGKFELGISNALKAEQMARQQGSLLRQKDCFQVLSSLYEASGELANALKYNKQYAALQDSIAQKDQSEKLAEAETKFRLGDKNREVALLGKENELQKSREKINNMVVIALIGTLAPIILASVLLALAYRKSKTKNELLAAQKTEIENASALIREQSDKLLAVDKMKSRFFTNISHELRTPVTLISGMLEFMVEGNSPPKEKERARIALGNSRKLNAIVEEMLDLTRLESDKVVLKKKLQPLKLLLTRIINTFSSLLEKDKIELRYDSTFPAVLVEVDENHFEKIINNLIYNAIKFTPPGGWIGVNTNIIANGKKIEIQISDSGSGIAQEDLPYIFNRFFKSSSGEQKHNVQGTGIGLSLVKEFTELHEGTVSAVSVLGEGSTFTLCFPIAVQKEQQVETQEEVPIDFSWAEFVCPPAILLVEDHEEMRGYISEVLGNRFKIAQAANGNEALHWLDLNETDLIISDVMMPQMDGYAFLEHLKANEQLKHIPVIMLTARAADEDKLHGLSLGVDDYLIKPFNANELRIRVQNLLQNRAARTEWLQQRSPADEPVSEEQEFMANVVAYVENRIKDHAIAITDLADYLAVSERQLYRKTGELTGFAPAQLVKEIRLKKSWQLLMAKKVSKLSTLASEVGYESASYFARQFEIRFGRHPSELL